jgi:hypothetical protein
MSFSTDIAALNDEHSRTLVGRLCEPKLRRRRAFRLQL